VSASRPEVGPGKEGIRVMADSKSRTAAAVTVGVWVAAVVAGAAVINDVTRVLRPGSHDAHTYGASVDNSRRDLGVAEPQTAAPAPAQAVDMQTVDMNAGQAAEGVLYVPGVTISAPWPQVPPREGAK
jgi:hypothetical protein